MDFHQAETDIKKCIMEDDSLISHVRGCQEGVAVLFGMMNPLLGAGIAMSSFPESSSDLVKLAEDLRNGADINHRDASSWTALMHAAYGGYPAIVQFLLANGAQKHLTVNKATIRDWRGYTAAMIAEYYLAEYRDRIKTCQPEMRAHYEAKVSMYQQVANLLAAPRGC